MVLINQSEGAREPCRELQPCQRKIHLPQLVINLKWMVGGQVNPIIQGVSKVRSDFFLRLNFTDY